MAVVNVRLGARSLEGNWYQPGTLAKTNWVRRGADEIAAIASLENTIWSGQRKFAAHRLFYQWDDVTTNFPNATAKNTVSAGRIPMCHFRPSASSPAAVTWVTIANGDYNTDIRAFADRIAAWPNPKPTELHVHFDWECYAYSQSKLDADGSTRGRLMGTRFDFVAAYNMFVGTIKKRWQAQATTPNFPVYFAPGYMQEDFDRSTPKYGTWEEWYPGDEHVDFIGLDVYNHAPCWGDTSTWEELSAMVMPGIRKCRAVGHDMIIGEVSCQENDGSDANLFGPANSGRWCTRTVAGSKKTWIDNVRTVFGTDRASGGLGEDVYALCWYDSDPDYDWALDSSTSATAAFRALGLDPAFNGGSAPPPVVDTTTSAEGIFWNTGFEHGTLGVLENVTGDVTIDATTKKTGNYALRFNSTSTQLAFAEHTFDAARAILTGQVYFRLPATLPAGVRRIFTILGANNVFFRLTTAGKISVRWNAEAAVDSTGTYTVNTWVRIVFRVNYNTGVVTWNINGGADETNASFGGSSTPPLLGNVTFEGIADEANINTTSVPDWTSVSVGGTLSTFKADTLRAAHGTVSGRITAEIGDTVSGRWSLASNVTTLWCRIYVYLTAAPADSIGLIRFMNAAGTQVGRLTLTTGTKLQFRDANNTNLSAGAVNFALNQWIRIECRMKAGATTGEFEYRLFNTLDSTTADEAPIAAINQAASTEIKEARIGVNAAPSAGQAQFWMDDVAISSDSWIGPVGTGGGAAGTATGIRFGADASGDVMLGYIDDVVLSKLGTDYPMAEHYVKGYVPDALPELGGTEPGGSGTGTPDPRAVFQGLTETTPETVSTVQMPQLDTTQANHTAETAPMDVGGVADIEYARVVQTIAEVGNIVYLGGGFHSIGGKTREHLACFDHTDPAAGILNGWNPGVTAHKLGSGNNMMRLGVGGAVRSIIATKAGDWLYIAGNFTTIGGQPRSCIAKVGAFGTPASGQVDATFVPPTFSGAAGPSVGALALSPDEKTLYAGGDFTAPTNYLVALDALSGKRVGTAGAAAAAGTFAGTTDGRVEGIGLNPAGDRLYVGGKFGNVTAGGVTSARNYLACFFTTNVGSATAWAPNDITVDPTQYVLDLAVSPNGYWLACGTNFGGTVPNNALLVYQVHDNPGGLGVNAFPAGARNGRITGANNTTDTGNMQAVACSDTHAFGTSHANGPRLVAIDILASTRETNYSNAIAWSGLTRGGWAIHLSADGLNLGGACNSPRMGYARYRALTPATGT